MNNASQSQIEKMSIKEIFEYRRKSAENGDIKSLLSIAKYRLLRGSPATAMDILPELFYYYGRLHCIEELKLFISENRTILNSLPQSCLILAQNLAYIGVKFPFLEEKDISYLEEHYSNPKTFELFDIIMFDCDKLPRPINKFNKDLLNRQNTEFPRDFLIQVYDCFSKNNELDDSYDSLFVYSRIENSIIRKEYENIGLGEYCIMQPAISNEFYQLMIDLYGEECADFFVKNLSAENDRENFKKYAWYIVEVDSLERVAYKYFNNPSKIEDLKANIALSWLRKVNSIKINLI